MTWDTTGLHLNISRTETESDMTSYNELSRTTPEEVGMSGRVLLSA